MSLDVIDATIVWNTYYKNSNYREQALDRLKNNKVSSLNMDVYILGYLDGRTDANNVPKDSFVETEESVNWVEDMKQTFRDLGY